MWKIFLPFIIGHLLVCFTAATGLKHNDISLSPLQPDQNDIEQRYAFAPNTTQRSPSPAVLHLTATRNFNNSELNGGKKSTWPHFKKKERFKNTDTGQISRGKSVADIYSIFRNEPRDFPLMSSSLHIKRSTELFNSDATLAKHHQRSTKPSFVPSASVNEQTSKKLLLRIRKLNSKGRSSAKRRATTRSRTGRRVSSEDFSTVNPSFSHSSELPRTSFVTTLPNSIQEASEVASENLVLNESQKLQRHYEDILSSEKNLKILQNAVKSVLRRKTDESRTTSQIINNHPERAEIDDIRYVTRRDGLLNGRSVEIPGTGEDVQETSELLTTSNSVYSYISDTQNEPDSISEYWLNTSGNYMPGNSSESLTYTGIDEFEPSRRSSENHAVDNSTVSSPLIQIRNSSESDMYHGLSPYSYLYTDSTNVSKDDASNGALSTRNGEESMDDLTFLFYPFDNSTTYVDLPYISTSDVTDFKKYLKAFQSYNYSSEFLDNPVTNDVLDTQELIDNSVTYNTYETQEVPSFLKKSLLKEDSAKNDDLSTLEVNSESSHVSSEPSLSTESIFEILIVDDLSLTTISIPLEEEKINSSGSESTEEVYLPRSSYGQSMVRESDIEHNPSQHLLAYALFLQHNRLNNSGGDSFFDLMVEKQSTVEVQPMEDRSETHSSALRLLKFADLIKKNNHERGFNEIPTEYGYLQNETPQGSSEWQSTSLNKIANNQYNSSDFEKFMHFLKGNKMNDDTVNDTLHSVLEKEDIIPQIIPQPRSSFPQRHVEVHDTKPKNDSQNFHKFAAFLKGFRGRGSTSPVGIPIDHHVSTSLDSLDLDYLYRQLLSKNTISNQQQTTIEGTPAAGDFKHKTTEKHLSRERIAKTGDLEENVTAQKDVSEATSFILDVNYTVLSLSEGNSTSAGVLQGDILEPSSFAGSGAVANISGEIVVAPLLTTSHLPFEHPDISNNDAEIATTMSNVSILIDSDSHSPSGIIDFSDTDTVLNSSTVALEPFYSQPLLLTTEHYSTISSSNNEFFSSTQAMAIIPLMSDSVSDQLTTQYISTSSNRSFSNSSTSGILASGTDQENNTTFMKNTTSAFERLRTSIVSIVEELTTTTDESHIDVLLTEYDESGPLVEKAPSDAHNHVPLAIVAGIGGFAVVLLCIGIMMVRRAAKERNKSKTAYRPHYVQHL
ncbi:hypothetical protein SK128_000590 [Halocaridina rubra]|uniref:Uncharacterized protein n=1 Tax=Halocaridina rubra TaxID=373956 RepID=A0AAN8XVJ5_HALRR